MLSGAADGSQDNLSMFDMEMIKENTRLREVY